MCIITLTMIKSAVLTYGAIHIITTIVALRYKMFILTLTLRLICSVYYIVSFIERVSLIIKK